ncbi:MAG: hypothetical protein Q8L11_00190 [Candidatus Moranbacteria bacterium]|nr:hypothetical protein [bacterium]MDP1833338.1 hypothetical protein [Candidatus Moranbacteria bacterium]
MEKNDFYQPSAANLSRIGIVILLIAVFLLAWFVVKVGEGLVDSVPQSKIYDTQKGAQKMLENKR